MIELTILLMIRSNDVGMQFKGIVLESFLGHDVLKQPSSYPVLTKAFRKRSEIFLAIKVVLLIRFLMAFLSS